MKTLIAANWKCNPTTLAEAKQIFGSVNKRVKNIRNVEVVICSPFVYLLNFKFVGRRAAFSESRISNFKLGAKMFFGRIKALTRARFRRLC